MFLYAPDTEACQETHIWIPELKAITCAENANKSLHNIQTLPGARTPRRHCATSSCGRPGLLRPTR
jgi:alkyl sulfatase BDS1-like metallo-beta-lactamase superfamily hydrolase